MAAQYVTGSANAVAAVQAAPSMTVNVGSGQNRVLEAYFIVRGPTTTIASSDYAGSGLVVSDPLVHSSGTLTIYHLYLINPTANSNTLTVTPAATAGRAFALHAAAFYNVDQTAPLDQLVSAQGNSDAPSVDITPTQDNEAIYGCVVHEATTALVTGAGETELLVPDHGAWVTGSSYVEQGTAATHTVNWTAPAADVWVAMASSFLESTVSNSPATVTLNTADGANVEENGYLAFTVVDEDGDPAEVTVFISDTQDFLDGVNLRDNVLTTNGGALHPQPGLTNAWTGCRQLDDRFGMVIFGMGEFVNNIDLYFGPGSLTDGYTMLRIYTCVGTPGTDGAPANAAAPEDTPTPGWLAISDDMYCDAGLSQDWHSYTFSGANRIWLERDVPYMIIQDWCPVTGDPDNTLVYSGSPPANHPGNGYVDGASVNNGVRLDFDLAFRVYGVNVTYTKVSGVDAGFSNSVTPSDTSPFNQGEQLQFSIAALNLTVGRTYYWKARAKDTGTGLDGAETAVRSFTVIAASGDGGQVKGQGRTSIRSGIGMI